MARSIDDRRVRAVLWKKLTATDAQALLNIQPQAGTGGGAKHIPLRKSLDIERFLGGLPRTGGSASEPEFRMPVEGPVGEMQPIVLDYNIRGGSRGEWLVRRQNANERHPVWQPGRKLPLAKADIPGNYILLIRLADSSFHARAASAEEVARMPSAIQDRIMSKEQGVLEV